MIFWSFCTIFGDFFFSHKVIAVESVLSFLKRITKQNINMKLVQFSSWKFPLQKYGISDFKSKIQVSKNT